MSLDEKKKFITNFIYFFLWLITIFISFKLLSTYLLPFIIGIIIAYSVQKPASILAKKITFKKENFAAILSVIVYTVVFIIIILVIWLIYRQCTNVIAYLKHSKITEIFISIYNNIKSYLFADDLIINGTIKAVFFDALNDTIIKFSDFLSKTLTDTLKILPNFIISCLITVVATFYIAKDFEKLSKFVKGFISKKVIKTANEFTTIFIKSVYKYVLSYFKIFLLTFFELSIGFLILDIKNFLIMALMVALIDLLPIFGTGIILLPWAIIQFFLHNYFLGFGIAILYIVITIVRNFCEPKIISSQFDINPIFTLLFIFLGFRIGGIVGMLFFPIITTVLFTYFRNHLYDNTIE